MRIVLDTNVLVSGLLSPFGPPAGIVRMVSSGAVTLCLDARILTEYEEVLARPRFGFDAGAVAALLDYVDATSDMAASEPLSVRLPYPDYEPFLEVALACGAECLVTGDTAHFPPEVCADMAVLTSAQFIERFRTRSDSGDT